MNIARESAKLGEFIIYIAKLQGFWFAILFRYLIVGGIFPATAGVIDSLFRYFKDSREKNRIRFEDFKKRAKENFKRSNQVGYIALAVSIFLYVDFRIAYVLMKNAYFTVCISALIVIVAGSFLYLIPSIVRYELSLKDSFRQAFFLLLSNILNTIAMLIGMTIALLLAFFIPVLVLVPVPLLLLSNAWFSYQAMKKLEKANQES